MLNIIIINWNAGLLLKDCINSINKYSIDMNYSIIVVDNASSDGSALAVKSLPNVEVIFSSENLGFGKACNLGVNHAKCDYILFLNPDTLVYDNSINFTLDYINKSINTNVGICGIQLEDSSGNISRSCARFPNMFKFVMRSLAVDKIFKKYSHLMVDWAHDVTCEVDHVIGAFMMVKRSTFDSLGGFDERFFLYYEDLDLSYRAHQAGWTSVYLTGTKAFHLGGGTSNQVKAKRLFYSLRSRTQYVYKHFNFVSATIVLLVTIIFEFISRVFYTLIKCSWTSFKETILAYKSLLLWLPQWLFKGVTR